MNHKIKPSSSKVDSNAVHLFFESAHEAEEWYYRSEFAPKINYYELPVYPFDPIVKMFFDSSSAPEEFYNGRSMVLDKLLAYVPLRDVEDGVYMFLGTPDSTGRVIAGDLLRTSGKLLQRIVLTSEAFKGKGPEFGMWVRDNKGYIFDLGGLKDKAVYSTASRPDANEAYDGWYRIRFLMRNSGECVVSSSIMKGHGFVIPSPMHREAEGYAFKLGRELHLMTANGLHIHVPLHGCDPIVDIGGFESRINGYQSGTMMPDCTYIFQEMAMLLDIGYRTATPAGLCFGKIGGKIKILSLTDHGPVFWKLNGSSFNNSSSVWASNAVQTSK